MNKHNFLRILFIIIIGMIFYFSKISHFTPNTNLITPSIVVANDREENKPQNPEQSTPASKTQQTITEKFDKKAAESVPATNYEELYYEGQLWVREPGEYKYRMLEYVDPFEELTDNKVMKKIIEGKVPLRNDDPEAKKLDQKAGSPVSLTKQTRSSMSSATVLIWEEDFENGLPNSKWCDISDHNSTSGDDYWDDYSTGQGNQHVSHGSWSCYCADISDVSGDYYDNDMNSYLESCAIYVGDWDSVRYYFDIWYDTEANNDQVKRYFSGNGTNWSLSQEWSGNSGGFKTYKISLENFTNYYTRFVFLSNGTIGPGDYEGAYVDYLEIYGEEIQCTIQVTFPNGGQHWYSPNDHHIKWTGDTPSGLIDIFSTIDGGSNWDQLNMTDHVETSLGEWCWHVPSGINSDKCKVKVIDPFNSSCYDEGDDFFTITPKCEITINSPNGGETWNSPGTYDISWDPGSASGQVRLRYTTNGGTNWTDITNNTENDGTYTWNIPEGINSSQCKVKIIDVNDSNCEDESDNYFTITPGPSCNITVSTPNGGETWVSPSTQNIYWSSNNTSGYVKIQYTTDGSVSWNDITTYTQDIGSYTWSIPAGINSSQCKVKIIDANNTNCYDESDGYFTIHAEPSCPLSVIVPNCSVVWRSGTTHKISWIPANKSGSVKIDYSINGGVSWNNIISSTPDDSCYDWIIPNMTSNQCKIKVSDIGTPSCYDESDVAFTIGAPASPYIVATDINGNTGNTVTADINIGGNTTIIDAFSFDLTYNTNHLSFVNCQKGDLTAGWIQVDGNESAPGLIKVGGFNTTAIPVGSSGSIAKVTFQVNCTGCSECNQSHIGINNIFDDLAGMSSYCGTFSFSACLCGDVTNNGNITAEDALCAFRIYLNGGVLPPGYPECNNACALTSADANGDGLVTPADALGIFNRYLNGYWEPGFCGTTLAKEQLNIVSITLNNVFGQAGDMVKLPITVDNPSNISAFGMELSYPPDLLEFVNVSRTDVTEEWIALDGKESEAGIITLGGFNPQVISQSTSAAIAEVNFIIKKQADGEGHLSMENLTDDLTEAISTASIFSTDVSKRVATSYKLAQNHPNPFNLETTITYHVPEATYIKLIVYNVSGQKIKTLIDRQVEAGSHQVRWDGRDELGEGMASGIYVYKLKTTDIVLSNKMILLK